MPNFREFFGEWGGRENGGNARVLDVLRSRSIPWTMAPLVLWRVEVTYEDVLDGVAVVGQQANWAFTAGQNTDGTLLVTFSGDELPSVVQVPVAIDAADDASAVSAAVEAAVDAEGDLAGVLDSTTDNGGDIDVVYLDDVGKIDVTFEWVPSWQTWTGTFGGTIGDGNYDATFVFDGYNPIVVRTTRAGGTPTDEAALAVQHEADAEAKSELVGLLVSADDDSVDTNEYVFETGAPDVVVTCSAPGAATFTAAETTGAVAVAQTETRFVDLGMLCRQGDFPTLSERGDCSVDVLTPWGAGRTLTVGDAAAPDGIFGSTPLDLNTAGRTSGDASATEKAHRHEPAYTPIAQFVLGDIETLTQGSVMIEIGMSPTPR